MERVDCEGAARRDACAIGGAQGEPECAYEEVSKVAIYANECQFTFVASDESARVAGDKEEAWDGTVGDLGKGGEGGAGKGLDKVRCVCVGARKESAIGVDKGDGLGGIEHSDGR